MVATKRLIKTVVDSLKPSTQPYVIYDSEIVGLSIRVAPSGTKTWRIEYRVAPGGRGSPVKRMSIGSATEIAAEQARRLALQIRADAARGIDPAAERIARRKELTVADLVKLYEAEGCYVQGGRRRGQPIKPATVKHLLALLDHHVLPLIASKKLSDVTPADVERVARAIATGKTGKVRREGQVGRHARGGEGAAIKTISVLSSIFLFAVRRDLMHENPVHRASVPRVHGRRERFLTLEEIAKLGTAIENLVGNRMINIKAANIIRLLLLTGARRNEINRLQWNEVDLQNLRLVLAETKTGKSIRPLATAAAVLLASLPRVDGSPWVFPAERGDGPFAGLQAGWERIVEASGLQGVSLHTLRHTVGSSAVSSGESLPMTGGILGHSSQSSTSIYAHLQRDPIQRAADRAINPIAAALKGKPAAEIVALLK
jgi:integrase